MNETDFAELYRSRLLGQIEAIRPNFRPHTRYPSLLVNYHDTLDVYRDVTGEGDDFPTWENEGDAFEEYVYELGHSFPPSILHKNLFSGFSDFGDCSIDAIMVAPTERIYICSDLQPEEPGHLVIAATKTDPPEAIDRLVANLVLRSNGGMFGFVINSGNAPDNISPGCFDDREELLEALTEWFDHINSTIADSAWDYVYELGSPEEDVDDDEHEEDESEGDILRERLGIASEFVQQRAAEEVRRSGWRPSGMPPFAKSEALRRRIERRANQMLAAAKGITDLELEELERAEAVRREERERLRAERERRQYLDRYLDEVLPYDSALRRSR